MRNNARRCLVILMLLSASAATAQSSDTPYPAMAPVEQYLIPDRSAEIVLARSAAPPAIAKGAAVYVLTRTKFERAVEGTNGFVCLVARGWDAPFADPQFWNPKVRAPTCLNPPAAASIVPELLKRAELILAGRPRTEVMRTLLSAYKGGELRPPPVGAMSYMMSKDHYLGDADPRFQPHVMFYTPDSVGAEMLGANADKSPLFMRPNRLPDGGLEAYNIFVVAVSHWSDGSAATQDTHQHR